MSDSGSGNKRTLENGGDYGGPENTRPPPFRQSEPARQAQGSEVSDLVLSNVMSPDI